MVIELGILSYKLIIPLLYPIFNQLTKNDFFTCLIVNSPLLNSLMRSASYLLGGLIYLFVFYRSRHIKNSSTSINFKPVSENKQLIYVNTENDEKKKKKKIKINSEKRVKNNSERKIDMINNCNYNLVKEQKNGTISLMKFNKNFNFSNMCNNTINEFHLFFNKRNNNQNSLRTKSNEHTMNGKSYNKSKNKIVDGYDIMQFHDSIEKINEANYDENVKNLIIDNEKNSNIEINKND